MCCIKSTLEWRTKLLFKHKAFVPSFLSWVLRMPKTCVSKTNEAAPGAEGIDEDGYPSHFRQIINLNRKGGKRGAKIILKSALLILSIPFQRTIWSRRQFHLTWRWIRFIFTRNSFQYYNILYLCKVVVQVLISFCPEDFDKGYWNILSYHTMGSTL